MIIKIKTPGENNWRFYDNALSIQTAEIPLEEVPVMPDCGFSDQDGNFGFDNNGVWEEILMDRGRPSPNNILLVSFMTGDIGTGRAVNLYTNSAAYLLNDSGKTIERIF